MDVLIADGSEFVRRLHREVLAGRFDTIYEAENGVEAIEQYEENDPSLVVMEVDMTIRDGIEVTEEITNTDSTATVVICTSMGDRQTRRRAMQAGADGFVTKPYQRPGLLEEISSVMAQSG